MRVSEEDFRRWQQEGWLNTEQVSHLRQDLLERQRVTLSTTLYYLGGFLVVLAWGVLLSLNWLRWSAWGQFGIATGSTALLLGIGASMRGRALAQAGGLLCLGASAGFPLIIYALLRLAQFWPPDGWSEQLERQRAVAWALVAGGSMLLTLLVVAWQRLPLLTLLVGGWNWVLALDIATYLTVGNAWSHASLIALLWGVGSLGVGVLLEFTLARKWQKDYLFWWYLAGVLDFTVAFMTYAFDHPGVRVWLYLGSHAGLILLAQWLQRRTFLVVGALGIYVYVLREAFVIFEDSLGYPLTMLLLGGLLIGSGVLVQRFMRSNPGRTPREVDWF